MKTSENKASHLVASTEVELELVAKVRAPLLRAALASVRGADAGLVQLRLPLRASHTLDTSIRSTFSVTRTELGGALAIRSNTTVVTNPTI